MDELDISGKRYISTRRAAREHGYHSDYMGQLIRGKKVAGQKVGRAWYIDEESLNAYLGKAPVPAAPLAAPASVAEIAPVAPAVEHVVAQESVVEAAPEPDMEPEATVPEPVAVPKPAAPVAQIAQENIEQPDAYASRVPLQPIAQAIHHAPYIEENETRIPIRMPMPAREETGGLRYAEDDAPSMPIISRMPQQAVPAHAPRQVSAPRQQGTFPYISLSFVGVLAILVAAFASNFVSATVVSEQGKAASIQYAIHW
jgi:hypothetical protein